ncbi:MAG: hypothetical protein AVDCRST_MAG73-3059, partial [uncultured Thermomicrobiales bacterium]
DGNRDRDRCALRRGRGVAGDRRRHAVGDLGDCVEPGLGPRAGGPRAVGGRPRHVAAGRSGSVARQCLGGAGDRHRRPRGRATGQRRPVPDHHRGRASGANRSRRGPCLGYRRGDGAAGAAGRGRRPGPRVGDDPVARRSAGRVSPLADRRRRQRDHVRHAPADRAARSDVAPTVRLGRGAVGTDPGPGGGGRPGGVADGPGDGQRPRAERGSPGRIPAQRHDPHHRGQRQQLRALARVLDHGRAGVRLASASLVAPHDPDDVVGVRRAGRFLAAVHTRRAGRQRPGAGGAHRPETRFPDAAAALRRRDGGLRSGGPLAALVPALGRCVARPDRRHPRGRATRGSRLAPVGRPRHRGRPACHAADPAPGDRDRLAAGHPGQRPDRPGGGGRLSRGGGRRHDRPGPPGHRAGGGGCRGVVRHLDHPGRRADGCRRRLARGRRAVAAGRCDGDHLRRGRHRRRQRRRSAVAGADAGFAWRATGADDGRGYRNCDRDRWRVGGMVALAV